MAVVAVRFVWLVGLLAVVVQVPAARGDAVPPDAVPSTGVLTDAPPPATFTRKVDADPSVELHLALGLTRDLDALRSRAIASATPGDDLWGSALDVDTIARTMAAPPADGQRVVAALEAEGFAAWIDISGMYVHATPTVGQAAALFGVSFGIYSGRSGLFTIDYIAADQSPSVPAALEGLVSELTGFTYGIPYVSSPVGTSAAPPREVAAAGLPDPLNTGTPTGCSEALATGAYTPDQMASAYGLDGLAPADGRLGAGAKVAVLIDGDGISAAALDEFQRCFGLPGLDPDLHVVPPQPAPIEVAAGELQGDVETVLGLAPHVERLDIFQGSAGTSQWPLLFSAPLDTADTGGSPPDAISFSDADCEREMSPAIVRLLDDILLVHAAVGTTVAIPTGDNGSATCSSLPGTSQVYPATSWWTSAVGGTVLELDGANAIVDEVVWNDTIYSGGDREATGGGPSRLFDPPPWQRGPGAFPDTLGVPDLSLFASVYPGLAQVLDLGSGIAFFWYPAGGTSYATPTFATGVALVNARLRAQGLGRLGLATPLLYDLATRAAAGEPGAQGVLRDVVEGTNDVDGVGCCTAGPAYDLASGLGSVDFGRLATAAAVYGPASSVPLTPAPEPLNPAAEPPTPVPVLPTFTG